VKLLLVTHHSMEQNQLVQRLLLETVKARMNLN
jgi:hypothetical protein